MMKFATTTMTIVIGEVSKALHDGDLDSSSQRQRGRVPHTSCYQRHAREAPYHTPLVTRGTPESHTHTSCNGISPLILLRPSILFTPSFLGISS